ncbi:MAG TPA: DUF2252 family protein [Burkholderiales bacterium]|nr:DUF2252 family protein [Burkholderiales bacterium]
MPIESSQDVTSAIVRFNAGRDSERLALKYKALRKDAFSFFRGTCHLFWSEAPRVFWSSSAPMAWSCGDLHLQNFGCYKGDDRSVYFDINDFDEACAAPCYTDPVRLMSSILVAAGKLEWGKDDALSLCNAFATAYASALQDEKARSIDRDTAREPVHNLLDVASSRKRTEWLDSRTDVRNGRRSLRIDGKKALPASAAEKEALRKFMARFAAGQPDPEFFTLLDSARRITGTGSLGVERYVLLVEGKGSPDRNYLLDLKEARRSVLADHVRAAQPRWKSETDRVVSIQRRMQAVPFAFLHAVELNGKPFVLRGLQPDEDRFSLEKPRPRLADLHRLVTAMGSIVAWDQLRTSGWLGASTARELAAFGRNVDAWRPALIQLAENFAKRVEDDWRAFRADPPQ